MPWATDRTQDASATTGTGPLTLTGVAPTGYQSFAAAYPTPVSTTYTITDNPAGANWEVGRGTYNPATGILTRDQVYSSSNAGALVSFTSGALIVFPTIPSNVVKNSNIGYQTAAARGWNLP